MTGKDKFKTRSITIHKLIRVELSFKNFNINVHLYQVVKPKL